MYREREEYNVISERDIYSPSTIIGNLSGSAGSRACRKFSFHESRDPKDYTTVSEMRGKILTIRLVDNRNIELVDNRNINSMK